MQAAAHSKEFARKAGIKQSVAKEFEAADQAKKKSSRADKIKKMYKK